MPEIFTGNNRLSPASAQVPHCTLRKLSILTEWPVRSSRKQIYLRPALWNNEGCRFSLAESALLPELCNMRQSRRVKVRRNSNRRSLRNPTLRLRAERFMTSCGSKKFVKVH